jgi:hypothetical protein
MGLSLDYFSDWLHRYFEAWVSNDPAEVSSLFSEEAVYFYGPFQEPMRGKESIVANWIANPGKQAEVVYRFEALATQDDLGIAHWNVRFRKASGRRTRYEIDGILVLRFNSALECVEHREWFSSREIKPTDDGGTE